MKGALGAVAAPEKEDAMTIRKSAEDYLEAILILKREKGVVHSVDVAHHMGYSKPSVSRAVTNLRQSDYLTMLEDGELLLTEKGQALAESIYERHTVLTGLLVGIGVPADIAAEDACLIEHVVSPETFSCIKREYAKRNGGLPAQNAPQAPAQEDREDKGKDDKKKKKKKKKG